MSIHAPSAQEFQSLLRVSRASIANPPWFASPVDAEEDDQSITIVFHVPEEHVQVRATDDSVVLRGRSRAMRLCSLPCSIVSSGITTTRSGDLLRVRVPKKQAATSSTEASSVPAST